MHRVTGLKGSVSFFLLLAMLGPLFVTPVVAGQEIRRVPTLEYPTIQAAINAANPGDIVQVDDGTYSEHVVVNKSLTIVGGNKSAKIIDGNGTGIVVRINAPDVEISGFTVQNGGGFPNSTILLGGCVRNKVRDNIIRGNALGIELHGSNGCIVVGNEIMNCSWAGIYVIDSRSNTIHYNRIVDNSIGVLITSDSPLNTLYHNSFVDNHNQVQSFAGTTKWDDSLGMGNYWSDYAGVDDGSDNRTAGDGVGDTLLPHQSVDWYPLMNPWKLLVDVNGDGVVNELDLTCVREALWTYPGDDDYDPHADVNCNDEIDTGDKILVARYLWEGVE